MFEHYFQSVAVPENEWHYCTFYECCKRVPCARTRENRVVIQKNHDFKLSTPISKTIKYMVLYRADPVVQLEAYFRYRWCWKMKMADKPDYSDKKTRQALEAFVKKEKVYYDDFLNKWVYPSEPNRLRLTYDELVMHPIPSFRLILRRAGLEKFNTKDKGLEDIFRGFDAIDYRNRLDPETHRMLKSVFDSS
jgi:hypothetical protein